MSKTHTHILTDPHTPFFDISPFSANITLVFNHKFALILALSLALAGCGLLGGGAATPTLPPLPTLAPTTTAGPTDTATVAATAAATTAPAASDTPAASATVVPTTPAATSAVTATVGSATPAGTATVAVTQGAGTDKADFVADVTVPDGTTFIPGQAFVKTWQLKNTGTNAWSSSYALVFVRGDQMGGPASVPLSGTVAPGATADVSVSLTAPTRLGSFTGFWMLRNPAGKLFGISADANQPVYLKINVGGAAGTPLPTGAPGAISVSAVTLGVEPANFSGTCPQTYSFTGTLTSVGAGKVTYRLDATSDQPGFVFDLPDPVESLFNDAGPRTFTVNYKLTFTGSVSGQATLHVLTPKELTSDKVAFSLTCSASATGTPQP